MPCLQTNLVKLIAIGFLLMSSLVTTAGEAMAAHFYQTAWQEYDTTVKDIAGAYRIDPRLVHAVIWQESNYDYRAVSSAGAKGLMQLMPRTARELGVTNSFSPSRNIDGGTRYLIEQLRRFGSVRKALQAYHCGPSRVTSGRVPSISKRYANQVITRYRHIKRLYPAGNNRHSSYLVAVSKK